MDFTDLNFNLDQTCRTCLSTDTNVKLLEDEVANILKSCQFLKVCLLPSLSSLISTKNFFQILDNLPAKICEPCSSQAMQCLKFKELCEKSEQILLSYLNKESLNNTNLNLITCNICQNHFSTDEEFKIHLATHYTCIHCEKSFSSTEYNVII